MRLNLPDLTALYQALRDLDEARLDLQAKIDAVVAAWEALGLQAMRLKDSSVSLTGIRPELVMGLVMAESHWPHRESELIITSANDARHSATSLHYAGAAVDIRSWNVDDKVALRKSITEALGLDFDFILEEQGGPNEHFHLEWQPKRR